MTAATTPQMIVRDMSAPAWCRRDYPSPPREVSIRADGERRRGGFERRMVDDEVVGDPPTQRARQRVRLGGDDERAIGRSIVVDPVGATCGTGAADAALGRRGRIAQ